MTADEWECLGCGNRTTTPLPWGYGKQQCPTCGSRKMRPTCGNRLSANEPGCTLAPGHEGWHTDGWSSWLTDENDNIVARRAT